MSTVRGLQHYDTTNDDNDNDEKTLKMLRLKDVMIGRKPLTAKHQI